MRIVLTGGTGFIGRACLRLLIKTTDDVLVLARRPRGTDAADRMHWRVADLNDPASYAATLAEFRPDTAIHLAWEGIPDYSLENSLKNLAAGARFAERLFHAGCRRFVAGGSCWEYGALAGTVREGDDPCSVGVFGACKTAQRHVLDALATAAGASLAWARIFYVYGPGQKAASLAPSLCADLRAGRPLQPRTPQAVNDFIYVDDVARGLLTLAGADAGGVFNLGSGVGTAVTDFAALLARTAGGPAPAVPAKAPHGKVGLVADIGRMTALGWCPRTPLATGIDATWAWFQREQGAPC